jgi:signal recognition particle receptor subunit beta
MVLFNYATKELTAKIVYYGPGLCGKTTNLQFIHENLPGKVKGKMLSLATKTDRTLFFDFLPLDLGEIRGMKTRVQLYTVPGQVFYNETRKLVLKGVDGVVFVADSQNKMLSPNVEAFKNLQENLKGHGISLAELPHVIQFNKRDLPNLSSIEEINAGVNRYNAPFYESVATTGIGVKDTLNAITKLVLLHLTKKYGAGASSSAKKPLQTEPAVPVAVAIPTAPVPAAAQTPAIPLAAAAAVSSAPVAATPEPAAPLRAAAPPADPPVHQETPAAASPTTPAIVETAGPVPVPLPAMPSGPTFNPSEIDDLVNDVQASDVAMDEIPVATPPPIEPALPPVEESGTVLEPAAVPIGSAVEVSAEVTLTQALEDHELFNDPGLEVARLAAGMTQDVIIPVEVGTRRFKLSLRLQLDDVN